MPSLSMKFLTADISSGEIKGHSGIELDRVQMPGSINHHYTSSTEYAFDLTEW